MIARARWWGIFLADVALVLCTSAIAGVVFGVYALREDLRFAWRRPMGYDA